MPELPEVTALCEALDARLHGKVIGKLEIAGIATLKTVSPSPTDLTGLAITAVGRRGKFIVITAEPFHLVVHLARGGWIRWREPAPSGPVPRRTPLALRLHVDGGALDITEQGHEKRLAAYVVNKPDDVPGIARLGIDALDPALDEATLASLLKAAGGTHLKTVLANQSVIAGIGNAYSDEILHAARLSPFSGASRLDAAGITRLREAIGSILGAAVSDASGREPSELKDAKRGGMRVHGRTGEKCPVCGDVVRQVDLGSRSLQYCAGCQTNGKVYADRRLSKLLK